MTVSCAELLRSPSRRQSRSGDGRRVACLGKEMGLDDAADPHIDPREVVELDHWREPTERGGRRAPRIARSGGARTDRVALEHSRFVARRPRGSGVVSVDATPPRVVSGSSVRMCPVPRPARRQCDVLELDEARPLTMTNGLAATVGHGRRTGADRAVHRPIRASSAGSRPNGQRVTDLLDDQDELRLWHPSPDRHRHPPRPSGRISRRAKKR